MGRGLLAIDEAEVPGPELLEMLYERILWCVVDSGVVGLGKECFTECLPVEVVEGWIVLLGLDGLGVGRFM